MGPPKSTDIMPPTTAPRRTRLDVPMPESRFAMPVLMAAMTGLTANMTRLIPKMPTRG